MTNEIKVFGMPAEKGRWVFVLLGLVINISLGSVYAWSVFRKPLESLFHVGATESGMPFMFFLAFFALLMPFAGGYLDKYGPRTVTMLGGVLVGSGWILASFASGIAMLSVSYGLIAGGGVGLVYGGPIALATKWFPDKKGLAVGLTIMGFGLSPFITAPLAVWLIGQYGPLETFRILGIIFFALIVLLAMPLKFPPIGWKPRGWTSTLAALSSRDFPTSGMLKTSSFYGLWFCYVIGTISGLMAIGIASSVGQEIVRLNAATAAIAVSVFAVFNGVGRPLFGWLTDRIKPKYSAVISFVLIFFASVGMLFVGKADIVLYMIYFSLFWLCLGGWLAIAPASSSTFFGGMHHGKNYGVIFTAYGLGAILGTLMSGMVKDKFGSYTNVFYLTAALAVIGIIIAIFFLKQPKTESR
ncbi:OFA family MFS transporter [Patescibacteria group bacterium]|nr:OFA family MFS transporter [Patescibacteria group bacterium]